MRKSPKDRLGVMRFRQHAVDALEPAEVPAREALLVGEQPVTVGRREPQRKSPLDMQDTPCPLLSKQEVEQAALPWSGPGDRRSGGRDGIGDDGEVVAQAVAIGAADDRPVENVRAHPGTQSFASTRWNRQPPCLAVEKAQAGLGSRHDAATGALQSAPSVFPSGHSTSAPGRLSTVAARCAVPAEQALPYSSRHDGDCRQVVLVSSREQVPEPGAHRQRHNGWPGPGLRGEAALLRTLGASEQNNEMHDPGRANTTCRPHHARKMITAVPARQRQLADMAVAILAVAVAGFMLVRSFPLSDELWRNHIHDRNGRYAFGLKLAIHVRDFDITGFLVELEKPKVWPQLHGLVLAAVLLVGGIDHRLGIVPSLIGWVMTVWFCWKIAVRSFDDRSLGIIAGIAAVALVATSPAFALISTDVMLEGLGSGLSALCLWAFMAAHAEPDKAWRWRLLAVALTLLFFEKYNYWAFVVTSIALAALLIDARLRALAWSASRAALAHASEMLKNPFFIAGIVVLGAAAAIGLQRTDGLRYPRQAGFGLSSLQYRHRGLRAAVHCLRPALAHASHRHRPVHRSGRIHAACLARAAGCRFLPAAAAAGGLRLVPRTVQRSHGQGPRHCGRGRRLRQGHRRRLRFIAFHRLDMPGAVRRRGHFHEAHSPGRPHRLRVRSGQRDCARSSTPSISSAS